MEILDFTREEPFITGTDNVTGWEIRLMKLEDTSILFLPERKCAYHD